MRKIFCLLGCVEWALIGLEIKQFQRDRVPFEASPLTLHPMWVPCFLRDGPVHSCIQIKTGRNQEVQRELKELHCSKEASELQLREEIKCVQPPPPRHPRTHDI